MNDKLKDGLIFVVVSVAILVLLVLFTSSTLLKVIFAIPFLLFSPGYCLMLALFPSNERFGRTERVVLSLVLSVAMIAIVGIELNSTSWGITADSILFSLTGLTLIFVIISAIRIYRLPSELRFKFDFSFNLPTNNSIDKGLFIVLGLVVVSSIVAFGFLIANSPREEQFTNFYLLNVNGQMNSYPRSLNVGEQAEVVIGIYNQRNNSTEFEVEITIDGKPTGATSNMTVSYKETLEIPIKFVPIEPGVNQKVEFSLLNPATGDVYQTLFLFIDVT